jgi:hypothetical protein
MSAPTLTPIRKAPIIEKKEKIKEGMRYFSISFNNSMET